MFRRVAAVLTLVAALGGLSACGNKEKTVTRATSESAYLDISGLKYQVQVSRQINPADPEDRDYLKGIPAAEQTLPPGTVWFGVFMRVENGGKDPIASSKDFTIRDTQGNLFKPIPVDNAFGYRPELLPGGGLQPNQEQLAAYAGTQGQVLIFKLPISTLDNRPLELTIRSQQDARQAGTVDLDV